MSKWEIEKGEDTYGFWIYENGKTICEVEEIEVAEQIVKEHNGYEAMREACESAKLFIKYARYELRVGRATIGCQFPCKEDADIEIKKLEQALKETQ